MGVSLGMLHGAVVPAKAQVVPPQTARVFRPEASHHRLCAVSLAGPASFAALRAGTHSRWQQRAVARRGSRRRAQCRAAEEPRDVGARRQRVGVILLNIGTPNSLDIDDVAEYLSRFLGDRKVVDIEDPEEKTAVLKNILGAQPARSVESYKRIWDPVRGSPLLFHSEDLVSSLQAVLGPAYEVCVGFQYSEPSLDSAMARLTAMAADRVVLVPMFPHFAEATVAAFLANATEVAVDLGCSAYLQVLPPFYRTSGYIAAVAERVAEVVGPTCEGADHLLFSFHGIPQQLPPPEDPRNSYRAQCIETAALVAKSLRIPDGRWSLGYQSRVSLRKAINWITPYTDELLKQLPSEGKQRLAVCAPSYTADCIETLGELALDGRDIFLDAGGTDFLTVPGLNSSTLWVQNLASMIRELPATVDDAVAAAAAAAADDSPRGFWAM